MAEIPQGRDFLTWSTENFVKNVKQQILYYLINWLG